MPRCRPRLALLLLLLVSLNSLIVVRAQSADSSSLKTSSSKSLSTTTKPPTSRPSTLKEASSTELRHRPKTTTTIAGGASAFKTTSRPHFPSITPSLSASSESGLLPTHSPFPRPPRPVAPPPPRHQQSGWTIFLEAAGALAGLIILFTAIRCCWSYKRTPRYSISPQDGIQQIRRELRESRLNRFLHRIPPPPYEAAPDYETTVRSPEPAMVSALTVPLSREATQRVPYERASSDSEDRQATTSTQQRPLASPVSFTPPAMLPPSR